METTPDGKVAIPYGRDLTNRIFLVIYAFLAVTNGIGLARWIGALNASRVSTMPLAPSVISALNRHVVISAIFLLWWIALFGISYLTTRHPKGPLMTLSPEGIDVKATFWNAGMIGWDEIESIARTGGQMSAAIGITVRNAQKIAARLPERQARTIRLVDQIVRADAAKGKSRPHILIPSGKLPMPPDQLIALIRDYQDKNVSGAVLAGDPARDPNSWPPAPRSAGQAPAGIAETEAPTES